MNSKTTRQPTLSQMLSGTKSGAAPKHKSGRRGGSPSPPKQTEKQAALTKPRSVRQGKLLPQASAAHHMIPLKDSKAIAGLVQILEQDDYLNTVPQPPYTQNRQ